jgi:hypothetical protein
MCVDFVEAKTDTRSLVSSPEEIDVFGGKYLESQTACGPRFWDINSEIAQRSSRISPYARKWFHENFEAYDSNGWLSWPVGTTAWIVQYYERSATLVL